MSPIVGFHRSHEASVAVLDDAGRPESAISEERLSRIKMQGGWPKLAAEWSSSRIDLNGSSAVCGGLPLRRRLLREARLAFFNASRDRLQVIHGKRLKKLADIAVGRTAAGEKTLFDGLPRRYVDHHTCHAASAYYQSGFDEAEVVTVDGVGDAYSVRLFHGRGGRLRPRRSYFHTDKPLGHNYEYVTAMLGYSPHRHAGKVTGLAAHADPDDRLVAKLGRWLDEVWSSDGRPYFLMMHTTHGSIANDPAYEQALAELRERRAREFGDWSDADLASAIQHILEREVIALIRANVPRIDGQPICLAGGVFANVRLNKLVKEQGFGHIFVQPAMGDGGLALGGPLAILGEEHGLQPYRLDNVYLGPEFDDAENLAAITAAGLEPQRFDPVEPEIARRLADGRVLARFNGRMEFGPRALGNRSILFHASDPTVNDWLNERLHRTEFMPFAPAILEDQAADSFFDLAGAEHAAEFMTITFDCTERFRRDYPAAVHVDGTARPQVVTPTSNPSFHSVLEEYRKLTGLSAVINTSFNMHEEPIVCTPEDAVRSFLNGGLDCLAIGNYLVDNPAIDGKGDCEE